MSQKRPPKIKVIAPLHIRYAYTDPVKVRRLDPPSDEYNTSIILIEDSIRFTLWCLGACVVPYEGGRLKHFDFDGEDSVIWKIGRQAASPTKAVEYYFDNKARLISRPMGLARGQAPVLGKFELVNMNSMPYMLKMNLLGALAKYRRAIKMHWPQPVATLQPVPSLVR